jgi:hypothetical protein
MQVVIKNVTETVHLKAIGKNVDVQLADMPEVSMTHIFDYGLRQILNDAMASGKTPTEREALMNKRLDNLLKGTLRASGGGSSDPVRKRAIELAETKIAKAPKFVAWVVELKKVETDPLKALSAKAKKLRELAVKAIEVEGNQYVAQAKLDVEAAQALDDVDIEI